MTDPVATWRLVAGGTVVMSLAVALAVLAAAEPAVPSADSVFSAPDAPVESVPTTASVSLSTLSKPVETKATGSGAAAVETTAPMGDAIRESVAAALAAWGTFAGTGDLRDVDGFFDPEGPQWVALVGESGTVGEAFEAGLEEWSLVYGSTKATLRATVTFVGDGNVRLVAGWEIELRPGRDGRWLIWSVSEVAAGPNAGR